MGRQLMRKNETDRETDREGKIVGKLVSDLLELHWFTGGGPLQHTLH